MRTHTVVVVLLYTGVAPLIFSFRSHGLIQNLASTYSDETDYARVHSHSHSRTHTYTHWCNKRLFHDFDEWILDIVSVLSGCRNGALLDTGEGHTHKHTYSMLTYKLTSTDISTPYHTWTIVACMQRCINTHPEILSLCLGKPSLCYD